MFLPAWAPPLPASQNLDLLQRTAERPKATLSAILQPNPHLIPFGVKDLDPLAPKTLFERLREGWMPTVDFELIISYILDVSVWTSELSSDRKTKMMRSIVYRNLQGHSLPEQCPKYIIDDLYAVGMGFYRESVLEIARSLHRLAVCLKVRPREDQQALLQDIQSGRSESLWNHRPIGATISDEIQEMRVRQMQEMQTICAFIESAISFIEPSSELDLHYTR